MSSLLASLNKFLSFVVPVMAIGLGVWFLYLSAFERIPSPDEMTYKSGVVHTYQVALSRTNKPEKIRFKLWNDDTLYWTNDVHDAWADGRLDGTAIFVEFYTEPGPIFRMSQVKTFGLKVNSMVVRDLAADLRSERNILRVVFPILALVVIMWGIWQWPRREVLALRPEGSLPIAKIDKGFALSWNQLSPRRRVVRMCWISGIAIAFVITSDLSIWWKIGAPLLCGLGIWQEYITWRHDSASPKDDKT